MKLDVLGQTILGDIHKFEGFENAIIAGGYCRDQILGGQFKDVDIFVPNFDFEKFEYFVCNLPEEWKFVKQKEIVHRPNYKVIERIVEIIDFKFMECIDIQVMNTQEELSDKFGENVISRFSYGIDQTWSSGEEVYTSEQFNKDQAAMTASLIANDLNEDTFPHHMKKFFRFQEKYPEFSFRCPKIRFETPVQTLKTADPFGLTIPKEWVVDNRDLLVQMNRMPIPAPWEFQDDDRLKRELDPEEWRQNVFGNPR